MNIAFVSWYSFNTVIGGLESVSYRLAVALSQRGHSVCLSSVEQVYDTPGGLDRMIFPSRDQVDGDENYRALVDYFLQHQVQVIVSHNAYRKKLGRLLHRVAKAIGAKLVFVLHTSPDYFLHKRVTPACILPLVRPIRRIKRRRMWRQMYAACDAFVLLAEPYRALFAEITELPTLPKVTCIPNPNTYPMSDYQEEVKENTVLFVGRLSREKGIPTLIQAWRTVAPHYPDWRLMILGDGPCRVLLEEAKLPRCTLLGVQQPQSYYARAKLLLMASDYEGWGMSLVEGMQYGVVPIVYDSYGAASVILDQGRAGVLVPRGAVADFAHAMATLMSDEPRRRALAEQAAQHVQRFDMHRVCDQWEALLASLLQSADQ